MIHELMKNGYYVIKNFFSYDDISNFKKITLFHQRYFPNTRPNPSSRHLVEFHKSPYFKDIYEKILKKLEPILISNYNEYSPLDLTDITINRSQPWHIDLLRGNYRGFIENYDYTLEKSIFKVLIYLSDQRSLQIIKGHHLKKYPLDDCEIQKNIYHQEDEVEFLNSNLGDIIFIDLRLPHCGLSEEETFNIPVTDPKVLITQTFADLTQNFVKDFLKGNQIRTNDWKIKYNFNPKN